MCLGVYFVQITGLTMRTILFVLLLFSGNILFSQELPVKFTIENLRNADGSIVVSVYTDSKSFDDGLPSFHKVIPKKENTNNGILQAQFFLPPGVYGLVFTDDENNDGEMTNNFIGIPKEGFGFSNFYLKGFKKPTFSDFSFTLTENLEPIQVRLRYM